MSNKRDLKRSLNYASSELFAEGVSLYLTTRKEDQPQIDAILTSVLKTHRDMIKRVSHPEPGMKAKVYYKHLTDDFNKQVDELIDQIQALV